MDAERSNQPSRSPPDVVDPRPSELTRVTTSPNPLTGSNASTPASTEALGDQELGEKGLVQAKTVIRQAGSSGGQRERTPTADPSGRTPAEVASVLVGQQLNQYSLQQMVGGGGMGAVFRAHDQTLDRTVALKVIPFVGNDPELQRRFRNEAQNAAKLDHPRIARIFDAGRYEDWHYIVFEYIDGINLRDHIRDNGVLTLSEAIAFTAQVAEALQHAAQRGIVHRDIKPSNVLVSEDGTIKLVDMGLARSDSLDLGDEMTASGVTLGTFDYISPEQAFDPRDADIRSDLYSLGCTLYFMLTGQPPYTGGTMLQKLISHGKTPPPDPREQRPDLPDELIAVMNRMMAKEVSARYQNADDLLADLAELSRRYGLKLPIPGAFVELAPQTDGLHRLQYHLPWMIALILLFMVGGFLELQAMADRDAFVVAKPNSQVSEIRIPQGFQDSAIRESIPRSFGSEESARPASESTELTAEELSGEPVEPDRIADAARPPRYGDEYSIPPALSVDGLGGSVPSPDDASASGVDTETRVDAPVSIDDADPEQLPSVDPSALPPPATIRVVTPSRLAMAKRVDQVDRDSDGAILVDSLPSAIDLAMRFGINRVEFAVAEVVSGPIVISHDNLVFESTVGRTVVRLVSDDRLSMRRTVMVQIGNHRTEFRDLDFEWALSNEQVDGGAMFEINDNRLTQFQDCTFTLENKAMHERVSFFDVVTDPEKLPDSETLPGRLFNQSSNTLPLVAIRFDNAVARGEATFIRMDFAAALQLVWNNGLIALNGRLLETSGALRQPSRLDSPIQ
ncbi:MAG: serine/threonine-protein kinase, partial [Planctomycetota bacterium]